MRQVKVFERRHRLGKWENIERGKALFHQFGTDYEEFDNGPGNFSTAIVEWPDGTVENVPVWLVQFTEPSTKCSPNPQPH